MFKNLLDKAKSAIEDIDLSLKNNNNSKAKKAVEYDATYFSFSLEGGPLHTSILTAVAKVKAGEKAGEPVPLNCKWFISTIDGKMTEIEGLNGSTYHPCAEDVGSRISVQAIPVLDGIYTGMPVYGEVGPLVLDKAVEERVMASLKIPNCEFKVSIEKTSFEVGDKLIIFPCSGIISLKKQEKTVEIYSSNGDEKLQKIAFCEHTDHHPSIEFFRHSMTSFELQLTPTQTLVLSTETSIDRDVIATAIRIFGNDDLENQLEETEEKGKETREIKHRKRTASSNLQILMKREKLIKQIKQLEKENEDLKKRLENESEAKKSLEEQVKQLAEQISESKAENAKLQEEIKNTKTENENLIHEKIFLVQEVNLYRSQNAELETVVKSYESQPIKSKESIEKETINSELEETVKELKARLVKSELVNEQIVQEKEKLNQQIIILEQENEQKNANLNSLKRKIQSLIQENEKAMALKLSDNDFKNSSPILQPISLVRAVSQPDSSPCKSPDSPTKRKDEIPISSPQNQAYEYEIKQLKQANEKLISTIETLKSSSPTRKNKLANLFDLGNLMGKESSGGNQDYLQKLVNTLTEVIAEKDLLLESHKTMTKELSKRVTQLEQQIKASEKSL